MRHQEWGGCLFELNMFFREGASSHYLGLSILLCGCEDFEGQSNYCKHDNWATYNKILKMYFIMLQIQLPIYFRPYWLRVHFTQSCSKKNYSIQHWFQAKGNSY